MAVVIPVCARTIRPSNTTSFFYSFFMQTYQPAHRTLQPLPSKILNLQIPSSFVRLPAFPHLLSLAPSNGDRQVCSLLKALLPVPVPFISFCFPFLSGLSSGCDGFYTTDKSRSREMSFFDLRSKNAIIRIFDAIPTVREPAEGPGVGWAGLGWQVGWGDR